MLFHSRFCPSNSLPKRDRVLVRDKQCVIVVVESCRVKWCHLRSHFAIILLRLLLFACSRSEFGQLHRHAVLQNPTGVELEIRTREGRKQFAVSEPVAFEDEEFYTSKYAGLWQIEILEAWNVATNATSSAAPCMKTAT